MDQLWNGVNIEELYNCSKYSHFQWKALGKPNWLIGIIYIFSGIIYELLYIPLLIVMLRPKFLQRSCYKIMFFLGIIDFACIFFNSIVSGYLSIVGDLFCTNPIIIYLVGCISTGLWAGGCATCLLLGLNRCLALVDPTLARNIFGGYKTCFWLILPTIYGIVFILFTSPLLFTSRFYAMFFNPNIRIPGFNDKDEEARHPHVAHTINNISIIVLLSCAYLTLCIILVKNRGPHSHIGRLQHQTFLQASIICGLNATAAVIYVIMQFFPTPNWLIILGQITWQASHGAAVFIYLFLNRSLRDAALLMLQPRQFNLSSTKRNLRINSNNRKPALSFIPTKQFNENQTLKSINSTPQLTTETISIIKITVEKQ